MSEGQNENVSGENQSATNEHSEPNVNELMSQLETLKSEREQLIASKERVLRESQQHKEKWQSMKSETERERQERLQKEGKFEELLKESQEKISKMQDDIVREREEKIYNSVKFEVSRLAGDAHDVNDLLGKIKVTKENIGENGQVVGIAEQVDAIRKANPYLFKQGSPSMNNQMPNYNKGESISGTKKFEAVGGDLKQMSSSDLRNYLKENYK
jgi:hypothetical protein